MMTSIEEVNLRVSYQAQVRRQESANFYTQLFDAQTDRRDIRLKIDVVRDQRTAYETELQEVHLAYLSSEAQNRALLSHIEWQRQSTEDLAVTQMMRIHTLKARAHTNTVEDANSSSKQIMYDLTSCYEMLIIMPVTRQGTNDAMTPESIQAMIDLEIQRNSTRTQDDASQSSAQEASATCTSLMCTKFLTDETKKVDKYISGLPDNIHGNVMSARPKTLDETIELANDLIDQKLRTYAERQNESKRKVNDSPRNNQQQPHKKQNVARAYTAGPGKKKVNTNNNNNNNNNKNQKAGACYECGNTGHIKKNCPKLKNHGNGSGNGVAQGRVYALGGRDASPDSNVITGTFLLNNRYAKILFDTGVNTIIHGCTLNFMNHPFNIHLMPVPLGSFDVIIRMDWLTKYHGVIICEEKIVRVPFGREILIFQGNGDNQREESRLNIISCTKAQEYLSKGCAVFLAHVTTKEAKDKSEGKRLEDVSIVRDFPEVFPEDLPGIPPTRPVEFQIDLVPSVVPVARAPYRLAPSE
nr:hypothetical protein [Tanacetum cinerariifolium]